MKLVTSSIVLATLAMTLFTPPLPCSAQSVPDPGPGPLAIAEYVFSAQKLFISDGLTLVADGLAKRRELFYSLDLKSNLAKMALHKDGSTMFMFSDNKVQPNNVVKAEWGNAVNLTTVDMAMGPNAATDTDLGLVVAVHDNFTDIGEGGP
ncbi:hypothetical protein BGZ82_004885 [Podila clonocystis]|nr:hypothetical protein BGZ82_004885 [Podila clonocystis]